MNIYRFNDLRKLKKYTAEPLVPKRSPFEFEIALQSWKGTDQIPAELSEAGSETLRLIKVVYLIIHPLHVSVGNDLLQKDFINTY
jgi:hypothetical protein